MSARLDQLPNNLFRYVFTFSWQHQIALVGLTVLTFLLEIVPLEIQRRVLGPEHADAMRSMTTLANTLAREGRYTDAAQLQRETLDVQRRSLGPPRFFA